MKELQIEVYGFVQGLRFRQTVYRHAVKAHLKGYIANRADGSVFICAQGAHTPLLAFLAWIQSSPGLTTIASLTYHWKTSSRQYDSFTVLKTKNFFLDQAQSFFNLGKRLLGKTPLIVPRHIALIPDGNRRWAQKRGMEVSFGHYYAGSYSHIRSLLKEAQELGVACVSLWGFSTENWKRSQIEQKAIFDLIMRAVPHLQEDAHRYKIGFKHIGRKDRLPAKLVRALEVLETGTKQYRDFQVLLCLDYGGRDELIRAVNKMLASGVKKVDEKSFKAYLDSADVPDPDFIIRTSGEKRTSGFMPFQGVYAELYFTDSCFPDFSARELREAILDFGKRQRRFGGS